MTREDGHEDVSGRKSNGNLRSEHGNVEQASFILTSQTNFLDLYKDPEWFFTQFSLMNQFRSEHGNV